MTNYACLDQTIDESSWSHGGYGESGTSNVFDIKNKPGCSRGGQVVLCCDSDRIRPRAYVHRYKCHLSFEEFTQGQNEVRMITEQLDILFEKGLLKQKPTLTADNFFSGDRIMHYMGKFVYFISQFTKHLLINTGKKGYGYLCTVRRDRLPRGVPKKYFHHEKTQVSERTRVARFIDPVVASKTFNATDTTEKYEIAIISF